MWQFVYGNLVAGGFVEPFFVAGRVSHVAFVVLKPFTPTIVSSFNPSYVAEGTVFCPPPVFIKRVCMSVEAFHVPTG